MSLVELPTMYSYLLDGGPDGITAMHSLTIGSNCPSCSVLLHSKGLSSRLNVDGYLSIRAVQPNRLADEIFLHTDLLTSC